MIHGQIPVLLWDSALDALPDLDLSSLSEMVLELYRFDIDKPILDLLRKSTCRKLSLTIKISSKFGIPTRILPKEELLRQVVSLHFQSGQ
jgi:hypothetical protein